MNVEFRKKLIEICIKEGIDISNDCENYITLSYLCMDFTIEYYMYKNSFYVNGGLTTVYVKGKEYDYNDYSIIGMYELEDSSYKSVDEAIDEVIDFIKSCNVRKRMLSAINSIESLIEDSEDKEFLIEYMKSSYD